MMSHSHYQANRVPAQVDYRYAAQAPPPTYYSFVQNANVHQPHTQAAVVHRQPEKKYDSLYCTKIGDLNVLVASPLEFFYNCPNNVIQFYQLQIVKVYDPRHGVIRHHPVTYYDNAETLRIKAVEAQQQAQTNLQIQMNAQAQQRAHRAQGLLQIQVPEQPKPEPVKIDKATWIEEETPTFKKFQDNFTSTDFLNFKTDNVWSFANAKEETFLTKRCSTPENKKKVDLEETLKATDVKLSPVESLADTVIGYSSTETESIKSYASVLAKNLDTLKIQEKPKTETEKPFKKWIDDKTSIFFVPRKQINENVNKTAAAENKCPNYNSNAKPEIRSDKVLDLKVAHNDDWDAKATSPKIIPSTKNDHEKSHTKAKNEDWTRKYYSQAKGGYRGWDGNWKRGETINDKAFERNGNSKAPYNKSSDRNEFDSKGTQKQQNYKPKGGYNNAKKYNPKYGQREYWKSEWYSKNKVSSGSADRGDNWHTDWDPQPMQLKKLSPKIDPQDEFVIKSQVPSTKKKKEFESKVTHEFWNSDWNAESPNNNEVVSEAAQDYNWKSDGGQLNKMDTLANLDDWNTEEPFHYKTRNFTNSNYGKEVPRKLLQKETVRKPILAEEFNEFGKRKMPTDGHKSKEFW